VLACRLPGTGYRSAWPGECLLQLLEQNEQVLTQRYLFAAVWEKQGAVVTTNALYQTIASIRKALKSAGLEENVIITIPKAGFKSVAQLRTGTVAELTGQHKTGESSVLAEVSSIAEEPAEIPPMEVRRTRFWTSPLAYGMALVLFILSCSVLFFTLRQGESVFASYQPVGNVAGCAFYSSCMIKIKAAALLPHCRSVIRFPVKPGMWLI